MTTIFARCRLLGIEQREIAARAGVDEGYVSRCVSGRKPTSRKVRDAAEALLRERLGQQVETLGTVMAATLAEQTAGGGVDG